GVVALFLALVRPCAARSHEHRPARLELARAGRPRLLRRGADLARLALEPRPGAARALALEPGPLRRPRDIAVRGEPGSPGVSRMGVAAGGHPCPGLG